MQRMQGARHAIEVAPPQRSSIGDGNTELAGSDPTYPSEVVEDPAPREVAGQWFYGSRRTLEAPQCDCRPSACRRSMSKGLRVTGASRPAQSDRGKVEERLSSLLRSF